MSKRQNNITFRVLDDMTLRAFNADSAKSDTVSEWCCSYIGNPCKTLTTTVQKVINFNMEEKDKEYVEFKEAVIRYAIDKKLYSSKTHDYVPTMQMLSDSSVANISRLRLLYDSLVQRYGEDKVKSCPTFRIRKLTPRECFRLMDVDDKYIDAIDAYRFPDDDYEKDCLGKEIINTETDKRQKHRIGTQISDSKKYQLAGNSIVVNCMYHIFDNLFVHPSFSDAVPT